MSEPDWENFAKSILTDWPTGDLDGSVLFDLSLQYGMIQEVPGGYNSDHHIDAEGICPEEGDPWYEYTFRGEAGPGLYSINDMTARIEELEAKLAKAVGALTLYIYETTHLSAEEDDGSHWCKISKDCLARARTTLAELTGGKGD